MSVSFNESVYQPLGNDALILPKDALVTFLTDNIHNIDLAFLKLPLCFVQGGRILGRVLVDECPGPALHSFFIREGPQERHLWVFIRQRRLSGGKI